MSNESSGNSSPVPARPRRHRHSPRAMDILHEDRDIIVIDKHVGLLSSSPRRDEPMTAERILTSYLKKGNARSNKRAFVVHRLDRDTSGCLVFAKNPQVQEKLKSNWIHTDKHYLCVVHGHLKNSTGLISTRLAENKDQYVHSIDDPSLGRLSETAYAVIKKTRTMSILRINLLTGRKNQIRVHLTELGHPVFGDPKYGATNRRVERMALHSKTLSFPHPHSGKRIFFNAGIPAFFERAAGGLTESEWDSGKPPGKRTTTK